MRRAALLAGPAAMTAIAALAALAASAGPAAASEALAEQHACLNCHLVEKKLVGPAFKAVAAKYRGQSGAAAHLLNKVSQGGGGVWGAVPMPAMPQVPPEDAKKIVDWLLALP